MAFRLTPIKMGEVVLGTVVVFRDRSEQVRAREAEREVEHLQRELERLQEFPRAPRAVVTAELYGARSLRQSAPEAFADMARRYGELLELAVEKRHRKGDYQLSEKVRTLGDRLGLLHAGPRDVVELHSSVLRTSPDDAPDRAQALAEEGRFLLLELMGNLAAFYRSQFLALGSRPSSRPAQEITGDMRA